MGVFFLSDSVRKPGRCRSLLNWQIPSPRRCFLCFNVSRPLWQSTLQKLGRREGKETTDFSRLLVGGKSKTSRCLGFLKRSFTPCLEIGRWQFYLIMKLINLAAAQARTPTSTHGQTGYQNKKTLQHTLQRSCIWHSLQKKKKKRAFSSI